MTAEDPIRKYSAAVDGLRRARTKVKQMQEFIDSVAGALLEPYKFMVSNVSVGFPPEVSLVRGIPTLDATKWPSAQQIAEEIANLHQKYQQAENAYHALSPADKKIVAALPEKE